MAKPHITALLSGALAVLALGSCNEDTRPPFASDGDGGAAGAGGFIPGAGGPNISPGQVNPEQTSDTEQPGPDNTGGVDQTAPPPATTTSAAPTDPPSAPPTPTPSAPTATETATPLSEPVDTVTLYPSTLEAATLEPATFDALTQDTAAPSSPLADTASALPASAATDALTNSWGNATNGSLELDAGSLDAGSLDGSAPSEVTNETTLSP